jgi:hypothetical protein
VADFPWKNIEKEGISGGCGMFSKSGEKRSFSLEWGKGKVPGYANKKPPFGTTGAHDF